MTRSRDHAAATPSSAAGNRLKASVDELAIFGGSPAFHTELHVGRPNIGDRNRLASRINDLLDRRWLSNSGPFCEELERRLADTVGVKHCVATCNATVALEIVVRALGLAGEVIVPSMTFVATAHVLEWLGVQPVFADIEPATCNLDPARIEERITARTSAILAVHLWGRPCIVEALTEIARRQGLRLVFDAAHAFGCTHRGAMIGGFGDAEVFSFHATKFLNSFEGGAIATNDDDLAARARLMRNFGFAGHDRVVSVGINGKMTEAAAAMGLTSLESMESFVAVNRRNLESYREALQDIDGLRLLPFPRGELSNFQYVVVEVDAATSGVTRDDLARILWAENVLARRYFHPGCHRMEPYRSRDPDAGRHLPATERMVERTLVLPTGTAVETGDIRRIGAIVQLVVENAREVHRRLEAVPPTANAPWLGDD